jgi:hypothetical protein
VGNVVNLGKARKHRDREQAHQQASENRARHGRTKAEKRRDTQAAGALSTHLDQHRRDDKGQS